jgi:hypothetical protein
MNQKKCAEVLLFFVIFQKVRFYRLYYQHNENQKLTKGRRRRRRSKKKRKVEKKENEEAIKRGKVQRKGAE